MKNFEEINRSFTVKKNLNFLNFKTIVQIKARWLLTLIAMLTLGVGQMWADNEYNKRYLYVNSSNCSWWTDASSQPALNAYWNTACNDWAAFKEEADGALTSTSWYFDLSDMNGSYLYFRGFKIERHPKNTSNYWNTVTLGAQNNGTNNCLWINSDGGGMSWGNYAVPISSIALAASDNILSGSGTSGSPYLVPVGKSVTLTATPSYTPADGTMNFCANFGTSPSANPTTVQSSSTYTVSSTSKTELKCIGRNKYGDVYSADVTSGSVYVQGVEPSVGVSAAGSVTTTSATFNATVTVNGATTTAYGFKYGTTNNVETLKSGTGASTSGALAANATSFNKSVTGLSPSTTYYYISYVTTASGTYYSASTQSFTTATPAEETHDVAVSYKYGATVIKTATTENAVGVSTTRSVTAPTITGYTFSSWTLGNGLTNHSANTTTNPISITTKASGSYTLTANYTINSYNVTFNANNGSGSMSAESFNYNQTKALTSNAYTRDGYVFKGWATSSANATAGTVAYADGANYTMGSANVTLYAVWYKKAYFVNVPKWTAANVKAHVYTGGSSWKTWNDAAEKMTSTGTNVFGYTIYSYEFPETYTTVKFHNNGGNETDAWTWAAATPYYYHGAGTQYASVAAIREAWKVYGSWNKDGSGNWRSNDFASYGATSATYTVSLAASTSYSFKYVFAGTNTWYGSGGGDMSDHDTWTLNGGSDVTFTSTVAGTYTFTIDYSGMSSEGAPSCTLNFPVSYTLTYSIGSVAGNNGSISTSPTTASGSKVLSGNSVTLTGPAAKSGYTWKGWYTNAAGTTGKIDDTNRAITVTMNADKTLYACYTENNYTVTVNAGSHGSVASTSVTGHKDTKVTLPTATADLGYYFTGWTTTSGSLSYDNQSSATAAKVYNLTAAATVQANFAPIWALVGTMNSWNPATNTLGNFTTTSSKDYGYVDVDLNANTQYSFKIKNVQTSAFYKPTSSNTEITYANKATAQGMNNTADGNPNQTIKTAGKGTYRFTWNATDHSIKVTYPTSYTVTFGYGTGGSAVTASVESSGAITSGQYAAAGKDITFTQTPSSSGYTFKGWYTAASGGTAVSGMSTSDNVLDDIAANATVYAQYTANTYTVTFDKNGGTTNPSPSSKSVTFGSAYGTLPAGPTPPGAKSFIGWFTEASGGTQVTAETIVSTASNHILYAHYEDTYTVTVQYKCGSDVLRQQTSVQASESTVTADISAPDIVGYTFVNWTGDNATFGNASSANTTLNVTAATVVVANYSAQPTVYFKNNLGWDSVFVSFDCTWDEISGKQVPSNKDKPYYAMTKLGQSDVYYCTIPSTYTDNNYANWAWNIAFDNTNYGKTATTTNSGTWDNFYEGEFLGRGDFDPNQTMFIPYNGETEIRNGGTYYKTGVWMKYNSTESGYQVKMNAYIDGEHADQSTTALTATVAGGYEFSAVVNLNTANYGYGFKLYKIYAKNTTDLWYSNDGDIYSGTNSLPWNFYTKYSNGNAVTANSRRCGLHTEATGDYVITVSFATGKPMVNVEYPVCTGDFRLLYKDRVTWSNGAHDANWSHPSRIIRHRNNGLDTISFYMPDPTVNANAVSIKLQQCSSIDGSGNPVWNAGTAVTIGATATGIYNYKVEQNATGTSATVTFIGSYDGNFYIRTDVSDGGWNNHKISGTNNMTYSEYSIANGGFSHYYMRHVNAGQNIKFCIANDYSPCISDTLVDDDFATEWIGLEANVRFMWYHGTNRVSRAYISGSSNVSDRFLVLEGNSMIMAEDGSALNISGLNANEKNFVDDQNWIYEATIKAKPTARVKLTARFNNQVQYFKGSEGAFAEGTTVQLIGGTGNDAYKVRVIYDFKTNRLVGAWLPDDETVISSDWPIDADIMVLRYHQQGAKQIKFSGSGALNDVKTVYGAMQFNKYRINNKNETGTHANLGLSVYERDLYWISFPFEVNLRDVFGFGTYGKHWIIEYYDGQTRAEKGFWADSDPNWKFVTSGMRNNGYILEANQGYVLALDLDNMTEESDVWAYGTENVYLYFPSTAHVSDIDAMESKTINITQTGYECTINRGTPDGDRRVKDSYWHVLGVPSYANASHETANAWTGTVPNIDPDNWTSSAPYVYEWVPSTNKYTVHSSSTMAFKPMHSYYAQYAQETITWTNINATPPSVAARRNANQKSNYEFRLEMFVGDEVADQTYVSLRDDETVTTEFDFSYDLSKMTNSSFAKTNCIYTLIGYERVAANCLPLETESTTIVPVGVNIATDGDYTFTMPDGTNGIGVTLVDNETGDRTNLALGDYTVTLAKGTIDERFVLEISPAKTPTGIEDVTGDGLHVTGARKVMVDGMLYIVKDGKVFDARGARCK